MKSNLGNFYRHSAIFIWSLCLPYCPTTSNQFASDEKTRRLKFANVELTTSRLVARIRCYCCCVRLRNNYSRFNPKCASLLLDFQLRIFTLFAHLFSTYTVPFLFIICLCVQLWLSFCYYLSLSVLSRTYLYLFVCIIFYLSICAYYCSFLSLSLF